MALRLSKGLGRSPENWLAMQDNYNLWHARKSINLDDIEPLVVKMHDGVVKSHSTLT
jgi:plasmid maintenance system antidote protein VapI